MENDGFGQVQNRKSVYYENDIGSVPIVFTAWGKQGTPCQVVIVKNGGASGPKSVR